MSWDGDLLLQVLGEFSDASVYGRRDLIVEHKVADYLERRLEQRRQAVRKYRNTHREEYRARDRARWQRRVERKRGMREKLSTTRDGMTLHFTITSRAPGHAQGPGAGVELIEVDGYVTTGVYEDGRLGEFFVRVGKGAEEFGPAIDCWAEAASVALQYGAPVDVVLNKPVARRDSISGPVTGVKGITRCTSPYDLIARWLLMKYGSPEMQERIAKSSGEVQP